MVSFRDTIRTNASRFATAFKQKAQQQYEDGCLKVEAYIHDTPANAEYITKHGEPQLVDEQLEDRDAAMQVGDKTKETKRLAMEGDRRHAGGSRVYRQPSSIKGPQGVQSLPTPQSPSKPARDMSFYDNQTPEESRRHVQERLTSILGPERMKFKLIPSGHHPVDPVLEKHYQQVAINDILSQWESHKVELRRQEEERQRQAQEEEAACLRTQILLTHYRDIYMGRLEKLALYGPNLAKGVDLLKTALQSGSMDETARIVLKFTHQVLLPIDGLLKDCNKEIPLEEVGAAKLKEVWPIEHLEGMYKVLKGESNLPHESYTIPVKNFRLNSASNNAKPATTAPAANEFSILGAASASARKEPEEQQKSPAPAPAPEGSSLSKLLAATAEKANGAAQQERTAAAPNIPSIGIMPPDAAAREAVLQYVATDNMAFKSEVQDLFRSNDFVSVHRLQARECLQQIIDKANGEEGFLGEMDTGSYRTHVENCVTNMNTLSASARMNRDTQALKKLCGRALKLWAVDAK